ncbi:MAG: hypothetical protein OHK0039_15160 [Bacteroidia bacterium]
MSEENVQLAAEAWQAIDQGDFDLALQHARQLIDSGEETGYRIQASATYEADGDIDAAIAILQQGIAVYPDSWELYLQLSNLFADQESFDEAYATLGKARQIPEADLHWVDYYKAQILVQEERIEDALATLQGIQHPEVINEALCMRLELLEEQEHYDDMLHSVAAVWDKLTPPETSDDAATLSRICSYVAIAGYYEDMAPETIEHYIDQAIAFQRNNEDALWLIREMAGEYSDDAQMYALHVSGRFHDNIEEAPFAGAPFVTSYAVLADNEDEALDMVRAFEIEQVNTESIRIESAEIEEMEETDEQQPKGIYFVSDFFPPDAPNGNGHYEA